MRRISHHLLILLTLVLVAMPLAAQPFERTVTVDCDAGETLSEALLTPATELTVVFSGTCHEDVLLRRDRVTLRGADASATLVGTDRGVELQGAAPVTLEGFTSTGAGPGVAAVLGSSVVLSDMHLDGNGGSGLALDRGSSADVIDSTFDDNLDFGISAFGASDVTLRGQVRANDNGFVGVLLSTESTLQSIGPTQLVTNDNLLAGVWLQLGASGQFPPLEARRNDLGLILFSAGTYAGDLDLQDNNIGLFLADTSGSLNSGGTVDSNSIDLFSQASQSISFGGDSTIAGLALVGGSVIELHDVSVGTLVLSFGARLTTDNDVTVGQITCDGTVLTEGPIVCPGSFTGDAGDSLAPRLPALPQLEPLTNPLD